MPSPRCPVDSRPTTPFLEGRPDYEFSVPTRLDYYRCTSCGLVFANPVPADEVIATFYTDYTTHGQLVVENPGILSRIARRLTQREFRSLHTGRPDEAILDYGCGDGAFLAELRDLGYSNLVGYDFDPKALEAAKGSGAVIVTRRDQLENHGPYATIALNHVIEHLVDPVDELAWLANQLRPGGRLILRTPNGRSVLSRSLGASWRGWETPRHLNVFTRPAFRRLSSSPELHDLRLVSVTTSQAMFVGIFHGSLQGTRWRRPVAKLLRHGVALVAFVVLTSLNKVVPVGEELVVVLERRP